MINLLKSPILIGSLLLLILTAVILFLGPSFGLTRLDIRLFIILVLLVLWIVLLVLIFSRKSSQAALDVEAPKVQQPPELQPSGTKAGDSASGEGTQVFRAQLDRAMQWLRNSKLARQKGVDVLYRIPWYLVMGPPGSGKSTLLIQSELDFPYTDPDRSMGRRGLEATRDVDLWIANEALFIDTAGKFSIGDTKGKTWLQLLEQLKRARREKPLNGIILGIDISYILRMVEDQLKETALRLRSLLDEATRILGLAAPVYLVFAKCDLLAGFTEFFNDLNEEDRKKVWGCTLGNEQYQNIQPHQEFEKEFNLLCQELLKRRSLRITTKSEEGKEKIYSFPVQFGLVRNQLVRFVTFLFQPNAFRERPIFRGFYFTSAIQSPPEIDLVAGYLERHASIPPAKMTSALPTETRAYFINHVFTQVFFPDHQLAGTSARFRLRGLLVRTALIIALCILLPILLWLVIQSYSDNRSLLGSIDKAQSIPLKESKTHEELQVLQELRTHIERLHDCPQAINRPRFQWGMYVGDRVLESANHIYAQRLKKSFLAPAGQEVRIALQKDSESTQAIYNLLKTLLMMTESDPIRAEENFLASADSPLTKFWFQGILPEDKAEALKQLAFYRHMLAYHKDSQYLIPRNNIEDVKIISIRRDYLLTFDVVADYYRFVKAEGNEKALSMTIARALEGQDLDLIDGKHEIPGCYTRNGYETAVRARIKDIAEEYESEAWVLDGPLKGIDPEKPPREAMEFRLHELYFGDYAREWWKFLNSITIHSFKDRKDAADRLGKLSRGQDSPISRILKTISYNTWDDWESNKTGIPSQENLVDAFKPIHMLLAASNGQKPAISQYTDVVGKVYKQLYAYVGAGEPPTQIGELRSTVSEALGQTAILLQNFAPEAGSIVKQVLEQPIRMALTLTPQVIDYSPLSTSSIPTPLIPPGTTSGGGVAGGLIIRGKVTNKAKEPLRATLFLLKPGSTEPTLANYITVNSSDDKGMFQFPKLISPGKYVFFAKAPGYRALARDINLVKGTTPTLNVELVPE